ncbi:phosphotyrosine protein phosphatase [Nostoc sp. NIES-2111]
MHLLFLCAQNRLRSLTAEHMLAHHDRYTVRSAGTEEGARVRVTAGHIGWADTILVMERRHADRIRAKFATELEGKPILNLRIPDKYGYMDEALIRLLEERLRQLGIEV